jgi:hypothetical protein
MICSTEIEKLAEKLAKMKMAATGGHKSCVLNAPGTTRTCDLLVRSQTLYPAELRAHFDERELCHPIHTNVNQSSAIPSAYSRLSHWMMLVENVLYCFVMSESRKSFSGFGADSKSMRQYLYER